MSKFLAVPVVLLIAFSLSACAEVERTVANVAAVVLAIPTAPPLAVTDIPTEPPPLALALPITDPSRRITVTPAPTRPVAGGAGQQPAGQATPAATPTAAGVAAMAGVVQTAALNVRAGPGTGHSVVAVVDQDEQVTVIGRNSGADWFEVRLVDGRSGWVAAQYVRLQAGGATRPLAAPRPLLTPAPPPAPLPTPLPPTPARPLEVTFINPHYECENRGYVLPAQGGLMQTVYSRRSFQADLYIRNLGQEAVAAPWRPARWIITSGGQDIVTGVSLEWPDHNGRPYPQPAVLPGQMAGWTFRTVELHEGQWVKAVEFAWNGETYRQEFDLGPYGHAYNYRDCDR